MWNRRNEQGQPQQPQQPQPPQRPAAPRPPVTEAAPVSGAGYNPPPAYETPKNGAVIGPAMTVKGDIRSREDLYVDGALEGTLEVNEHRLTIGPNGKVRASIKAREVVIQGNVQGNVEATDKIIIRKEGRLVGDIKMAGIVIDDGAYFKGSIDIVRPDMKPNGGEKSKPRPEA